MSSFAEALLEHGTPTTREESWRYTALDAILTPDFRSAPVDLAAAVDVAGVDEVAGNHGGTRLVFVNGAYAPHLSTTPTIDGLHCSNLAATASVVDPFAIADARPSRPDGFRSLNASRSRDGALVRIDTGASVATPIHIVHVSIPGDEPSVSHARTIVEAGASSRATIVETYAGFAEVARGHVALTNAVTTILVGHDADVTHHRVQAEAPSAMHVGHTSITQDAGSRVKSTSFMLGGDVARSAVDVLLRGRDASADLHGLYLATGTQRHDNVVTVEHAASGCSSTQRFKGVVDDQARGSFSGHILVQPGTTGTDAHQTSRSLALTPTARADARPWLEILADDVRCTHGATVGRLDEEAMFYLRTRGIPFDTARGMLIEAFATEVLDTVTLPSLRNHLESAVATAFDSPPDSRSAP